ncbi:MAG: hypothetical protein V2A73_10760, partial [Pseudomonadota bacterium]
AAATADTTGDVALHVTESIGNFLIGISEGLAALQIGRAVVPRRAPTAVAPAAEGAAGEGATAAGGVVDPAKFKYLFGEAGGRAHNIARTAQNAGQMARVGVYNTAEGRALLQAHFEGVVADPSNIARTFTNKYGTFQVRESLFAGPGGFVKFESTWQVLEGGGYRFTTAIPFGGP